MSTLVKLLARAITECDLFSANIAIRYKRDDNFKTLTSGCISIIVLCFLFAFFIANIVSTVNMQEMNMHVMNTEADDPVEYTTNTDDFLFAIGISGLDLTMGDRYFNIQVKTMTSINGTKTMADLQMQGCQYEQWKKMDEMFGMVFMKQSMHEWLCPVPGQPIVLKGKFTSQLFKYIKIVVSKCDGVIDGRGCVTTATIDSFLAQHDYFNFNYYFINNRIDFNMFVPTMKYIDDLNTFVFSPDMGQTANIFFTSFEIESDDSVLPIKFEKNAKYSGFRVDGNIDTSSFKPNSDEYVKLFLRRSVMSEMTYRYYLKIDQMLSNVGGLFSIVFIMLQVPLYYYNNFCYELGLASQLFNYQTKQQREHKDNGTGDGGVNGSQLVPIESMDNLRDPGSPTKLKPSNSSATPENTMYQKLNKTFNFFIYIGFLPFVLLRKFGCKPKLKYFSALYETVMEIRKMSDIGLMMKRFLYLDRVCKLMIDQDKRRMIHLGKKETLDQIKRQRSFYKLYDDMTIESREARVLLPGVRNLDTTDRLKPEQREVINSYLSLKAKVADLQTEAILNGLDEDVLNRILKEIKNDEQTKRKILSIKRSLSISKEEDFSSIKIEDVGHDDSAEASTPVYRFLDNSPRARRL